MKKKTNPRKRTSKATPKRSGTRKARPQTSARRTATAAAAGEHDAPNEARLIITMTQVEGSGAERMSFTASAGVGRSAHFSEKHRSDRRFRAHDTILLSTDPGVLFAIEDEGNWGDDPPGPHNHLDRYRGFGGATRPPGFADAYVVKP